MRQEFKSHLYLPSIPESTFAFVHMPATGAFR